MPMLGIGLRRDLPLRKRARFQQGVQIGREQGVREGLPDAIEGGMSLRFGAAGLEVMPRIRKIENLDILRSTTQALLLSKSLEEIAALYADGHED